MSFISGLPRSATVVIVEAGMVNRITSDVLQADSFGISEWAISLARMLAERIRKTTAILGGYISQSDHITGSSLIQEGEEGSFDVESEVVNENARILVKGFFTGKDLNEFKQKIRSFSLEGVKEVIIDFSEVLDIDRTVIDFLQQLTETDGLYTVKVSIENVQLIKNKVLSVKGIQDIIKQSGLPQMRIAQGECLVRQNEIENIMYVVKTGKFSITRNVNGEEILLGYAGPGEVIGEMTLIKEGTRSATVRAEQVSTVYKLNMNDFYKNLYHIPNWFIDLIRGMVDRLRRTNDTLERVVHRQFRESEWSSHNTPIGIVLDSSNPGKLILQGFVVKENLEYLTSLVNLLIKRGNSEITLDLKKIKKIDYNAIRYVLQLYVYLQKTGGILHILGNHKEILYLFKQYDIELPESSTVLSC